MYFELYLTFSIFTFICYLWFKIIMLMYNQYEINYKDSDYENLYLFTCLSLSINIIVLLNYSQIDFITLSLLTTISYIFLNNCI